MRRNLQHIYQQRSTDAFHWLPPAQLSCKTKHGSNSNMLISTGIFQKWQSKKILKLCNWILARARGGGGAKKEKHEEFKRGGNDVKHAQIKHFPNAIDNLRSKIHQWITHTLRLESIHDTTSLPQPIQAGHEYNAHHAIFLVSDWSICSQRHHVAHNFHSSHLPKLAPY
jgi:hypothetical protein